MPRSRTRLLARATEALEAEFGTSAGIRIESGATRRRSPEFWTRQRSAWATIIPTSIPYTQARCSSRRIRWRGQHTRWR